MYLMPTEVGKYFTDNIPVNNIPVDFSQRPNKEIQISFSLIKNTNFYSRGDCLLSK